MYPSGIPVFFQNFISLVVVVPWALRKGFPELRTSRILLHILRAAAGVLSQMLMFAAVKKITLVNAVLLSDSAPLFIPLITWVWLKARIDGMVWVSLFIGFAGVILIMRPDLALLSNPTALLPSARRSFQRSPWSAVNQLSNTEPAPRILLIFLFSPAGLAPFALLKWKTPKSRE